MIAALSVPVLCAVQNGESSRDLLLSVTTRKALAPGGQSPPESPFEIITLLPVTFSQLDPQLGVGWGKRLLCTLIGYLLTDGLNCLRCQIFSRLAF